MNDLFDKAVNASGAEYLEAERSLRRAVYGGTAESAEALKRGAASPDPIARLLVEVLEIGRATGGQDYDNLEKMFVNLPAHTNRTPLGDPPPGGFASRVTRAYGARVTKFLALRLAKDPLEPAWLAWGSLLYLQEHKDPAATAAILRFITIINGPERREWALDALKEIGDPALGTKLAEAEAWAKARKIPFPKELRNLSEATR